MRRAPIVLAFVLATAYLTSCADKAPYDPYKPREMPLEDEEGRDLEARRAERDEKHYIRKVIGESVERRPIELYHFPADQDTDRALFVFFCIHGNEPAATALSEAFMDHLLARSDHSFASHLYVIPVANPDGLEAGTRTNKNGVDLNRNFPASNWSRKARAQRYDPGPRPSSEPETRILVRLIDEIKPYAIISVHAPLSCVNFDGPGEALAELMAAENGLPVKASIGYPTPGSFGSYVGLDLKIPVVTLELGPRLETHTVDGHIRGILAALRLP